MTVSLLAFQRNKERAGSSAARVGTDAVDYTSARRRSATQFATDFMGNTLKFCRNQMPSRSGMHSVRDFT